MNFSLKLGLIAEHTQGMDVKSHLCKWNKYDMDNFLDAWASSKIFSKVEQSWKELDEYINSAIAYLPQNLQKEVLFQKDGRVFRKELRVSEKDLRVFQKDLGLYLKGLGLFHKDLSVSRKDFHLFSTTKSIAYMDIKNHQPIFRKRTPKFQKRAPVFRKRAHV